MLAPAILWLLVSLTSSPKPCLAAGIEQVWASLLAGAEGQEPWRPPVDHLYNPPRDPSRESEWQSKWQGPARRDVLSTLNLPPPRPMELQRLFKPWGDGFVRMPVQRHVFNDTRHRRSGRLRRPNRPTYPAANANGNPTEIPTPGNDSIIHDHDRESSEERRDVAASSPPSNPGPDAVSAKDPKWGWSHLDDYMGVSYMLQLDIGTPPQKVGVLVDTGSYELWVNPKCITASDPVLCSAFGHYYPQRSSTSAKKDNENFHVVYGTGEAAGTYFMDSIKVSIWNVPSVQFAVADDTNYTFSGVLGLGYSYPFTTKYPTLLSMMWQLGYIAAPVFSMGLGGQRDGNSEIIFGGVNKFKYTGRLEPVEIWPPIDRQDPTWLQYWVNVTSIGLNKPDDNRNWMYTSKDFSFPMLIDTGSTLSYIREDVVKVLSENMGGWVDQQGNYLVDCKLRKTNGTVNFGFKGKDSLITVSYKDFIWEQNPQRCFLGFQPSDKGSANFVLGDTFIRGAYLVFDQQVDVVWMADYYNCGDGVQMVGDSPADAWTAIGQC